MNTKGISVLKEEIQYHKECIEKIEKILALSESQSVSDNETKKNDYSHHAVEHYFYKYQMKSKYWKDCPKCGLKMTYGQLVTEEGYCWSCNHRGVF